MFRCMRCSHNLVRQSDANGVQVVLHFEGGMVRAVAVYQNQQPLQLADIKIVGPMVHLVLGDKTRREQPAVLLFDVLMKGGQLWNLG